MLIRNGQWPGLAWKIQMGLAIVSVRAVYIYKHIYMLSYPRGCIVFGLSALVCLYVFVYYTNISMGID